MQLNDVVLSYKEEMVSQLCKLISMPSLEAPPLPGQPFGRACTTVFCIRWIWPKAWALPG